jgi:phosphomevalonate kinase
MEVIASAPGKLFVVGEYGVVAGGPAVVATVTRRLRCRLRTRPGSGEIVVRLGDDVARCALSAERVDHLPAGARFVAAAALVSARALGLRGVDLDVATESELDPGLTKSGLGGSAAATAATVCAVRRAARGEQGADDDEPARIAMAVAAHRLVQGGGSGGDVVAASVGGLLWIDGLDGSDVPADVSACVAGLRAARRFTFERLALPAPLALAVVASGRSCATGPRIARYAAQLRAAPGELRAAGAAAWARGMRTAAELFREGCHAGDARRVGRAVRAAAALLSRLGAVAAIPVYTAELRRACAVADQAGAAAKPSGAGGGDCAIALVAQDRRAHLHERWRLAGLEPLAVELDDVGARCEVTT